MLPIKHGDPEPRPTPTYEELVADSTLLKVVCRYLTANVYCNRDALANLIGLELPEESKNALEKSLDENAKAYPERQEVKVKVGDKVVIKSTGEPDIIVRVDENPECETNNAGEPLRYKTGDEHEYDIRSCESTCWFSASELMPASEEPLHDPLS